MSRAKCHPCSGQFSRKVTKWISPELCLPSFVKRDSFMVESCSWSHVLRLPCFPCFISSEITLFGQVFCIILFMKPILIKIRIRTDGFAISLIFFVPGKSCPPNRCLLPSSDSLLLCKNSWLSDDFKPIVDFKVNTLFHRLVFLPMYSVYISQDFHLPNCFITSITFSMIHSYLPREVRLVPSNTLEVDTN